MRSLAATTKKFNCVHHERGLGDEAGRASRQRTSSLDGCAEKKTQVF
jgi:hypothetical protein